MEKIIRILPAEGCNPDFAPEQKEQEGIECDGYFLLTFANDELATAHISNLSTMALADCILNNTMEEVIAILRQAVAVAEGYLQAREIWKIQNWNDKIKGIVGMDLPEFPDIDMDEGDM